MMRAVFLLLYMGWFLFLWGCSGSSSSTTPSQNQLQGEYINRRHHESFVQADPMSPLHRLPYPWEDSSEGIYPKITKDFFRCKGCILNPVHLVAKGQETIRNYDCGGSQRHSLPLKDQKEFIYPILIDLLNDIQRQTNHRVVITCGHCCPEHNTYLDHSVANQASKHMLGAEVDFYVMGMESEPEKIVDLIQKYYQENPKYRGLKDYQEFKRYDKPNLSNAITPWYNKEIFVKIVSRNEGRDLDNSHPYPYLCIQVRYDWDLQTQVQYTWDKAFRNFLRW